MYTLPQLADFSPAALDNAALELKSAVESESRQVSSDSEWKVLRDR